MGHARPAVAPQAARRRRPRRVVVALDHEAEARAADHLGAACVGCLSGWVVGRASLRRLGASVGLGRGRVGVIDALGSVLLLYSRERGEAQFASLAR